MRDHTRFAVQRSSAEIIGRQKAPGRIHQAYNQRMRLPFPCRKLFLSPSAKVPSKLMPGGADAPLRAKVIAGTPLSAWVVVPTLIAPVDRRSGLICHRALHSAGGGVISMNEPIADPPASAKPRWARWSTRESIEQEIPSITAIAETLIAVPLYWWLQRFLQCVSLLQKDRKQYAR